MHKVKQNCLWFTAFEKHIITMPQRHCYVEISNMSTYYTLANPR